MNLQWRIPFSAEWDSRAHLVDIDKVLSAKLCRPDKLVNSLIAHLPKENSPFCNNCLRVNKVPDDYADALAFELARHWDWDKMDRAFEATGLKGNSMSQNPMEDYLFLDWQDILRLMQDLSNEPDRETAHRGADHLLTVSLVKAACGEIDEGQARAIIEAYDEVDRWFS